MPKPLSPVRFSRWEFWALVVILTGCLALAVHGRLEREPEPVLVFLERAHKIEAALERFAADHNGAYPPDAFQTRRPWGLSDKYIHWDEGWFIDYEVHKNGHGGAYVCLEFVGPRGKNEYLGLCNDPDIRDRFGRGQPIPKVDNRIWVVAEDAKVLPHPPGYRRK